jgi:hypothetical protein
VFFINFGGGVLPSSNLVFEFFNLFGSGKVLHSSASSHAAGLADKIKSHVQFRLASLDRGKEIPLTSVLREAIKLQSCGLTGLFQQFPAKGQSRHGEGYQQRRTAGVGNIIRDSAAARQRAISQQRQSRDQEAEADF